jgi:uncharacterized Zn ribbon protein
LQGVLLVPRDQSHLELIEDFDDFNDYCVDSSVVYINTSTTEWSANVQITMEDFDPLDTMTTIGDYNSFEFKTGESLDGIPRQKFDEIVAQIHHGTFLSNVRINESGNHIIDHCHTEQLGMYPSIVFHISHVNSDQKIAKIIYDPSDYIIPINQDQCLLKIKPSDDSFHFGMTFFRMMAVHLLGDRIGICDPL